MTRIAVLGLTEPSLHLADALRATGAQVVGFDAAPPQYAPVTIAESIEDAVQGADIVLSFTAPNLAFSTAEKATASLKQDALFADFSATSPETKKRISEAVPAGAFIDAAQVSDITIEASGANAQGFADTLNALSVKTVAVSSVPGDVATRMLLRSLLAKSLATAVTDTLWAAESLGLEDWAWEEVQRQLSEMSGQDAQDLIDDTATNFKRHQIEMQDVVELLASSEYESTMVAPIQFNHGRIMHGKKIPHSQAPHKKWIR